MARKIVSRFVVPATVLLLCGNAFAAGLHQICYQDWVGTQMTAVFACRADDPAVTCSVSLSGQSSVGPLGLVKKVALPQSGSYTADIQFSDGTLRTCTVSALDPSLGAGAASQGATLVGYTSDASGRVMTGVWKHRSSVNATRVGQTISVPWDFVAVGGGVVGAETPYGALIYLSEPTGTDMRDWQVGTQDNTIAQPHDNDAYVIGLKIEGLSIYDLRPLIFHTAASSDSTNPAAHPKVSVPTPGEQPLGGGFFAFAPYANGNWFGQYGTASFPTVVRIRCFRCEENYVIAGWNAASKDHGTSRPGWVTADILTITKQLDIGGSTFHFVGAIYSATSAVASHPSIVVAGGSGEYALTGIGASVDWETYGSAGNLLWKLQPRPDIAGVEVASKDHAFVSPATITGYAIGIKLVPGPIPPPTILRQP